MKILAAAPYYYPKIGGLENYAHQLNLALQSRHDIEVVVVAANHEAASTRIDMVDGQKVYRLRPWFKLSNTPINPLWPLMIHRIIKREKPDLIIAHTPVPSMADAAALAAGSKPLIVFYHASTLLKPQAFAFNTLARLYHIYERLTLTKATRIAAVSPYVREQLAPSLRAKTIVIPNAVWRGDTSGRPRQPRESRFVFIGTLDRSHAWKGLDLIIQAIAIYRDTYGEVHLSVIGDGNDRARYEAEVAKCKLTSSVDFLGPITGQDRDDELTRSSALIVYPTTANDAFPTVMIEAWAKDVPVVAAAIGPIPSLMTDRVDGRLAPPHAPPALARVLHELMVTSPRERQALAETARKRTLHDYTWEKQAKTFEQLAGEILA